MTDSECECQSTVKQTSTVPRIPTLDTDLRVRRFQRGDTRRIHNLFLEETRCLLWPMFAQTIRSPPVVLLHLFTMAVGVTLARSCIFALFGVILAACAIFVYIYRWFYQYLSSSLKGDLANISQYYLSKAKCNFLVAEFDGSIVGFIAVDQKSETVAAVTRMSVDTCFRGKRKYIATRLLQEAFKFCQQCGYTELVVEFPGNSKTTIHRLRRCDVKQTRQEFCVARQG
ncbi:hypothetical protein OS493_020029 [Desmophyllum pertusum]|uniref:N-acetyltransferase domain-containing protein n=1 Tax=Desmophyllum pertusum TaxID=174260 RepID=A0A9W9YBF3_9CNID|nr:hypothetical protein OS493_020029 [Desmophyllum pertusum]